MHSPLTLQARLSGHGRSLLISFLIAALTISALCGVMALMMKVQHTISQPEHRQAESVEIFFHKQEPTPQKSTPRPIPQRIISTPIGPPLASYRPPITSLQPPLELEIPKPDPLIFDDVTFEEIDFDNPFVKEKLATKVVKKTQPAKPKKIAKKAAQKKTSGLSEAERKLHEQRRLTALAKKITRQAAVTSRSKPRYPRFARRKGHQGRTVILVTVSAAGKVTSSRISQSSGHASLDQSALKAAQKHRFRPALNGLGQPVTVQRKIPFNFKLTS